MTEQNSWAWLTRPAKPMTREDVELAMKAPLKPRGLGGPIVHPDTKRKLEEWLSWNRSNHLRRSLASK